MNRKVQILALSCIGFLVSSWTPLAHAWTPMYSGAIQFPSELKEIPAVRIYLSGNKITSTEQNNTKKTTFTISTCQPNQPLYVLVTENVRWHAEENTIKNLRANPHNTYRFYCLHPTTPNKKDGGIASGYWHIQELALDAQGNIPDNTVIVIMDPEWIEDIKGGDSITLPTLHVRPNILELVGSERALHATTESLLLSAIDSDTIHKKINHVIKPQYHMKTVLALTT